MRIYREQITTHMLKRCKRHVEIKFHPQNACPCVRERERARARENEFEKRVKWVTN